MQFTCSAVLLNLSGSLIFSYTLRYSRTVRRFDLDMINASALNATKSRCRRISHAQSRFTDTTLDHRDHVYVCVCRTRIRTARRCRSPSFCWTSCCSRWPDCRGRCERNSQLHSLGHGTPVRARWRTFVMGLVARHLCRMRWPPDNHRKRASASRTWKSITQIHLCLLHKTKEDKKSYSRSPNIFVVFRGRNG